MPISSKLKYYDHDTLLILMAILYIHVVYNIVHKKIIDEYWLFHFCGCPQSYFPLTTFTWTPGRSWVRPPSINTTLCSCKVCPSFGMKAVNSFPLLKRTRQHFLWAEFGFFGFRVIVCSTIPFNWGLPHNGPIFLGLGWIGPLRIIWLSVRKHWALVW